MRRSFSGGPQRVPYWGIMRPTRPKWRVWVAPARGSHHHANTASTALQKGRARRRAAGFLITTSRFFQLQHGSARWASSLMLDRFVESSIAGGRDGWVKRSASRVGSKAQKTEARWWPVRHGRFTYAGRCEEVPGGWSAGPKAATVNGRRSAREREGGRHCRHRRLDFCAHCRLSMSMTKPNKVVERACISHIARDRVATSKSR
jgi:hypothetical protein